MKPDDTNEIVLGVDERRLAAPLAGRLVRSSKFSNPARKRPASGAAKRVVANAKCPGSLSPVLRGEGWGEGPFSRAAQFAKSPLTLTLSPEYGGEGTGS